jgi:hypothetical protein
MNRFLQRDQVAGRHSTSSGISTRDESTEIFTLPGRCVASARYHLKLVSEGNFITKNIAVRYQLYVIGGSQADD